MSPIGRPWTPEEDAILRESYTTEGAARVVERLAPLGGRSRQAVRSRASNLGVPTRARWTEADVQFLRSEWGFASLSQIARRLGRSRLSVYGYAMRLGLPLGAPQGSEYLTNAAIRTGFDNDALRRILAFAGVKVRHVETARHPRRARYHTSYVDPQDVDDAIQKWMSTESIAPAARARGMVTETLHYWLVDAGVLPKKRGRAGAYVRVESETIDRVVAERRARGAGQETLGQAAERVGVSFVTLSAWLKAAGVPRSNAVPWWLDPAVVDQVIAAKLAEVGAVALKPKRGMILLTEAAARVGVTVETLALWLKKACVPRVGVKLHWVNPRVAERVARTYGRRAKSIERAEGKAETSEVAA